MPHSHSNTRIKKLSPLLINQLAAGEVVTRPSAVVKELLENAIDAYATNIEVHITQGGMGMIEVIDNGVGIHPDDMVMAVTRHATSKVADVAHLHGITTLGFRGEALAATAAVSRLTLISSHDDSGIGRQLQVAGILDDMPKLIPVVHHRGTTITVKDLYFNVPARRGNLKSIATEFGHIETMFREVALARADVALTLFHDNKKRLSLSVNTISNDNENYLPLSRLEQATGLALTEQAIEVAVDLSSLTQHPSISSHSTHVTNGYTDNAGAMQSARISGWLWPSCDTNHHLPKLIYVNGRLVKEALISNQLRQMAQSAQLAGMGYALYFELPTQWLNVNVHPSKQRIKISPLNNIMAHLSHAVRAKLRTLNPAKIFSNKNATPNSNVSTKQSFNTSDPIASSTTNAIRTQQIQAPKQTYQLSANELLFQNIKDCHINESIEDSSHAANSDPVETSPLPVCLEIINSVAGLIAESSAVHSSDDKALPWLLFYHQGQCVLISAERWQSILELLFESTVFSSTMYNNAKVLSSTTINQQLAKISMQMSAQDAQAFVADMEATLSKYAIHSIESNQLVVLMLSSASKQ
ncbi:DNA mismatch repair protein MutL [Psychrobacter arcticus 273-4]|uniref:DNA mismatch repair protein MutL n=1 Tax=Psychrobacter arcticus (strain DSM 17307 / VKM B-2377 / 273-4) TaxID=259536 RepID=Q4FT86_PSYA2|nr:DNA mismatch repair endonuclease MutL [Psychrobacter arcticus]AAZ18772.1 DNA mismatch repair protein MutL [Psychrobacter arcticus 273-4]